MSASSLKVSDTEPAVASVDSNVLVSLRVTLWRPDILSCLAEVAKRLACLSFLVAMTPGLKTGAGAETLGTPALEAGVGVEMLGITKVLIDEDTGVTGVRENGKGRIADG